MKNIDPKSKELCKSCRAITLEHLLQPEGFLHIEDPERKEFKSECCSLCDLIYESIEQGLDLTERLLRPESIQHSDFTVLCGLNGPHKGLDQILVCRGNRLRDMTGDRVDSKFPLGTYFVGRLDVAAMEGDPAAQFLENRKIPRVPGSESSWFMIDQLVDECANHHAACKAPQDVLLPSRVLDVGAGTENEIHPFVSNGRYGKYAALSYCWGGQQKIVARSDNWEEIEKGIPVSSLPKTIRDAVMTTRRMGLQYLWIDAMCVLQDSKEDWDLESPKMGEIYGNAAVTIAAAGGSHCNSGCFIESGWEADEDDEDGEDEPAKFIIKLPNKEEGTIFITIQNAAEPYTDFLDRRGWTLQESLLSSRLLIFRDSYVAWQCQSKFDRHSCRLPPLLFQPVDASADDFGWYDPIPATDRSLATLWMHICQDYSRRSLTFDKDSFPALSGLARKFQQITGDVYLAGLWKKALVPLLTWSAGDPRLTAKQCREEYVAPTWSWVGIRSAVFWGSRADGYTSHIEILAAETTLGGLDPTGPVVSGKITLRGKMHEASLALDNHNIWHIDDVDKQHIVLLMDHKSAQVSALHDRVWCLWVHDNTGLLLKRYDTEYERVGVFRWEVTNSMKKTEQNKFEGTTEAPIGLMAEEWFKDSKVFIITLV